MSRKRVMLGGVLVAEAIGLLFASAHGDLFTKGNAIWFVAAILFAGCFYLGAVRLFPSVPGDRRPLVVWLVAIALRLCVLWMQPADDFWRYQWEGRIQSHGVNPYVSAPLAPELSPFRDVSWEQINHKEWPAIYPPLAEWTFARLTQISSRPILFKIAFVLADLGVIWILSRLLTGAGRWREIVWYAWNPAVVIAFAGAGHFDAMMVFAMTAAVWGLHRADPLDRASHAFHWSLFAAVALGVAISLKAVPVLLMPVFAFGMRKRAPLLVLSLAIPAALSWLYGGPEVVLNPLRAFANVARANGLFWWVVDDVMWPGHGLQNRMANATILAVCFGLAVWLRKDWRRATLWVLGAALLLSPVLHPWYVAWLLPIACWRRANAWFVLGVSACCGFLLWETTPLWEMWSSSIPIRLFTVVPPLIAWWRLRSRELLTT